MIQFFVMMMSLCNVFFAIFTLSITEQRKKIYGNLANVE